MDQIFGPYKVNMYIKAVTNPPPITTTRQPNWLARPATIGPYYDKKEFQIRHKRSKSLIFIQNLCLLLFYYLNNNLIIVYIN